MCKLRPADGTAFGSKKGRCLSTWVVRIVLVPENVVFRSTSMASQQNAIAAGRGIGLLPFFSAKKEPRLVQVMADAVAVTRSLYISVHEDLEYLGRIRALVHFLLELFRNEQGYLNKMEPR
jgi:DNA-binding transcriptional LysR family regulator